MLEYRKLWVNGCSLSFGAEILGQMDYSTKNLIHAWPVHLAKLLDIPEIENQSRCATSNLSILRSTIYGLSEIDTSDMLVIIQWTSSGRTEIIYDPGNINLPIETDAFFRDSKLGITTGFIPDDVKKNSEFFWRWQSDKSYQDELWLMYIWTLQNFLKNRNIDYIMVNGTEIITTPSVVSSSLYQDIDRSRFYGFTSKVFFKKDGTNKSAHPDLDQHIKYAKELHDYIMQIQ